MTIVAAKSLCGRVCLCMKSMWGNDDNCCNQDYLADTSIVMVKEKLANADWLQ